MEHLFYCTPEPIAGRPISLKRFIGIHTHSSEQKEEVAAVIKHFGKRPIELFYERGILGPHTVIAHCVWLNDREIQLLADTDTAVAHCPISNAKLACGVAPILQMQKKGIRIGIGTDGPISNNNLDMFEEMKFASLLQKRAPGCKRTSCCKSTPHGDNRRRSGYRNSHEIGSIEKGKQADLVLVDFWKPHLMPIITNHENPVLWNLIFAAKGSDVNRVYVSGELLVENGKLSKTSDQSVLECAMHQTADLLRRRDKIKEHAVRMVE